MTSDEDVIVSLGFLYLSSKPNYISSYLVLGILCRKIFILTTTKYPYHALQKWIYQYAG